jgi:tetratricopeptide (TPR) repeat protein
MRQTAAGSWNRIVIVAAALAFAAMDNGVAFAQTPDDIFTPNAPTATPPAVDTAPPATAPAVPPADSGPAAPLPGVDTPAPATPGERPNLPDMIQDQGREIDPQAEARLQEAFVEYATPGGDPQKVMDLIQESLKIQGQAHPEPQNQLFEAYHLMGLLFMRGGNYEQAVAAFGAAVQANPNNYQSMIFKGQAHFELKEHRQAVETLTDALNFDSKIFMALYWRGKARTEQRDYQAAIEDLQEAVSANRNSKEAYTALGKAQLLLGDAESAQASLDRAVKLDSEAPPEQKSTYAEVYFERGKVYASTGQLEKSAADLAIAVERDPKNREYLMNLGAIRHEVAVAERDPSQLPLAIEAFKRAIDAPKKPEEEKDVSPQVALARTYIEQGNMEDDKERATAAYRSAIETANAALEVEQKSPMAFYQRGVAQRMLENFDAAVASLGEAIRLAPAFGSAYYRRGIIWYHRGEYRLAGQDFDDALRAESGNPKYLVWRGLAQARQEKYVDAIESYSLALRSNPLSSRAYHNRALAYLAIGETEKAVADFNQAIRIDARDAQAFYRRGVALDQLGESDRAIESLSKAIDLKADFADALVARGRLFERFGEGAKAANDFAAAKKVAPAK